MKTALKDGNELLIREADEGDAEQLVIYRNEIGEESNFLIYGKNGCHITVEREQENIRDWKSCSEDLFLVGFIGETLVCSANLVGEKKERVAHNCELGIAVRKRYWNLGVGNALMRQLMDFARQNQTLKAIHLGVYENNANALHLYKKFGFQVVGRFRNYFKVSNSNNNGAEYFDEILMDYYL